MKKLIVLSMVSIFALPTLVLANENAKVNTVLDINTVQTTIPSKTVAETFGYDLTWNGDTKQVTFTNDTKQVVATSGDNNYIVNGETISLTTPMTIIDGVSYIPFNLVEVLKPSGYEIQNKDAVLKIVTTVQDKEYALLEEQLKANEEYKEAFLATGGDINEYIEPFIEIGADVMSADENYISVMVYRYQSLASSYTEEFYYTFDAKTGELCSLEYFLGEDYQNYVKNSVVSQMAKIEDENPEDNYFFENAADTVVIDENTSFYLDEYQNIVVVFPKYSLSAGVNGKQEFIIPVIKKFD